ncbi:MAG: hypothetical protein M3R61_18270 [Chloroflexota bacterium]|nr:hypothetical protein [Chloroflexota bacterium]
MRSRSSGTQRAEQRLPRSNRFIRMFRSRAILCTSLEFAFLMLTLLIIQRDARLSLPWSRPILWLAMLLLPIATIHFASTRWRDQTAGAASLLLSVAGASAFALIWPLIMGVFLFRETLDARYTTWIGIALILFLVAGILLITVARQGRQAFSIQPHQRREITLTLFVGVIILVIVFSFLR